MAIKDDDTRKDQGPDTELEKDQGDDYLSNRLKELEAAIKQAKSDVASLNRTLAARDRKIEEMEQDMEQQKMTEDERLQAQEQRLKQQREEFSRERAEFERQRLITSIVTEMELPSEFSGRIIGKTEEEIREDAKQLKEMLSQTVNGRLQSEVNKRLGGPTPPEGEAPKNTMKRSEFEKLDPMERAEAARKFTIED